MGPQASGVFLGHPNHETWMDGERPRDSWKTQSEIVLRRRTEGRGTKFGETEEEQREVKSQDPPGKKRSVGPIAEEILRAAKSKPTKKDQEWAELLRIPLAELPDSGIRTQNFPSSGTGSSAATKCRPPN